MENIFFDIAQQLSPASLQSILVYHDLCERTDEITEEESIDIDEYRAILLSISDDNTFIFRNIELSQVFSLQYDLLATITGSEGGQSLLTEDLARELKEVAQIDDSKSQDINIVFYHVNISSVDHAPSLHRILVGSKVLVLTGPNEMMSIDRVELVGKHYFQAFDCGYSLAGVHDLNVAIKDSLKSEQTVIKRVFIYPPVYSFTFALDQLIDNFVWGWNGNWTEELENSVVQLLVSIHEDVTPLIENMEKMFSMMGPSMGQDLQKMVSCAVADVQSACSSHSQYAVGRLHQSLEQFLDLQSAGLSMMFSIPHSMVAAIEQFLTIKLKSSPLEIFLQKIAQMMDATRQYHQSIKHKRGHEAEAARLSQFLSHFENKLQRGDSSVSKELLEESDWKIIVSLKPKMMDSLFANTDSLSLAPVIPVSDILGQNDFSRLKRFLWDQSFRLHGDIINIDSHLGFLMNDSNVLTSRQIIMNLLNHGLSYVASEGGKLIGLFPVARSVLHLRSDRDGSRDPSLLPSAWNRRLRELARVFRTKVKRKLSLRCNSNFDLALSKLREHHGSDCWVQRDLESVWRAMVTASPPELLIFELWYGDDMVAADFTHIASEGRTAYVATRFYDRSEEFKLIQAGFILSMAACKVLYSSGCFLWDLGGVNSCPLMRYKYELTGEAEERPLALDFFFKLKELSIPELDGQRRPILSGVLVDSLAFSDLFC